MSEALWLRKEPHNEVDLSTQMVAHIGREDGQAGKGMQNKKSSKGAETQHSRAHTKVTNRRKTVFFINVSITTSTRKTHGGSKESGSKCVCGGD